MKHQDIHQDFQFLLNIFGDGDQATREEILLMILRGLDWVAENAKRANYSMESRELLESMYRSARWFEKEAPVYPSEKTRKEWLTMAATDIFSKGDQGAREYVLLMAVGHMAETMKMAWLRDYSRETIDEMEEACAAGRWWLANAPHLAPLSTSVVAT